MQANTGEDTDMDDEDEGPTRDWGTDYVPPLRGAGKGAPKKSAGRPEDNWGKVIERLRISVPLLKYAKADKVLRALVTSQLMKLYAEDGDTVLVQEATSIKPVPRTEFDEIRGRLAGITPSNEVAIREELDKLARLEGRPALAPGKASKRGTEGTSAETLRNVRLTHAHVAGVTSKIYELMDYLG